METLVSILAVLLLVIANGFFVASEFALVKVRTTADVAGKKLVSVRELVETGGK